MGNPGQYIKYEPTPAEIKAATDEMKRNWTPREEAEHRGIKIDQRGRPKDRYWLPPGAGRVVPSIGDSDVDFVPDGGAGA